MVHTHIDTGKSAKRVARVTAMIPVEYTGHDGGIGRATARSRNSAPSPAMNVRACFGWAWQRARPGRRDVRGSLERESITGRHQSGPHL